MTPRRPKMRQTKITLMALDGRRRCGRVSVASETFYRGTRRRCCVATRRPAAEPAADRHHMRRGDKERRSPTFRDS